jgi:hypothetical protein
MISSRSCGFALVSIALSLTILVVALDLRFLLIPCVVLDATTFTVGIYLVLRRNT